MPVRGKKTPKPQLRHLFKVLSAAEENQFFCYSALKFTSIVLQVDNAKWVYKKANLTLRLSQLHTRVLFPTPFYCTQCSETSSNILSVRFYQALKKKSLPPAQSKCRNQSILVFRKIIPFLQHLEVLIKLQNTNMMGRQPLISLSWWQAPPWSLLMSPDSPTTTNLLACHL